MKYVSFSQGSEWAFTKFLTRDEIVRGLRHTLRLICFFTSFSSMGYCILFMHDWANGAPGWIAMGSPPRGGVHSTAAAAFLLENYEAEWYWAVKRVPLYQVLLDGQKWSLPIYFLHTHPFLNKWGNRDIVIFINSGEFSWIGMYSE